tara:strand:- start:16833 stop:17150 length:318 start_codon:yes stop_codon:yes gene_type:complete
MRAGQLRHRATLQSVTDTASAFGDVSQSWSTVETVWCNIEPLTAREALEAEQIKSRISHKVTLRYRANVSTKNRLVFDSRTFNITSVLNVGERNKTLLLMCTENE